MQRKQIRLKAEAKKKWDDFNRRYEMRFGPETLISNEYKEWLASQDKKFQDDEKESLNQKAQRIQRLWKRKKTSLMSSSQRIQREASDTHIPIVANEHNRLFQRFVNSTPVTKS